jgi:hypothetical protein
MDAKFAALQNSSALAICHSLVLKALPGFFVCVGVATLYDNQLAASAGKGGVAHVKVVFDKPVLAEKRPAGLTPQAPPPFTGGLSVRGLPSADLNSDSAAAFTSLMPALFDNLAQFSFAGAYMAGLDVSAAMVHQAEAAFDKVRLQGAAFGQATKVVTAATSAFSDSQLFASKSDFYQGVLSSSAALEASAAYAATVIDEGNVWEELTAAILTPRIEYAPFSMDLEARERLVTWAAETKPAGALSAPGAEPPPAAPFIAYRSVLDAGDIAYSGGEVPAPMTPIEDLPVGMVMRRHEDLEAAAAQPPISDAAALRFADLPAGGSGEGEAYLSPANSFEAGGPDVSANRSSSAANFVPAEEPRLDGFETPITPVSEDFRSGDAHSLGGPVGVGSGLEDVTAHTDDFGLDDSVLVQLRTLVDKLSDRFETSEWERISSSRALEAYIPVGKLKAAGIPLGHDQFADWQAPGFTAVQAAPGAGSGATSGNGESGFFGTTQSLVATASAGFDSNPFLAPGGQGTDAASVRLQLAPAISRMGERTTFRLSGRAEHIEYLGRYDSLQNYGADFAITHRANERVELDGGLLFSSDNLATNLANPFFNNDLTPGAPLPPIGNDITVLGQQQRRTLYGANGGLSYTLSERDELRWELNARAERFGSNGLTDSDFVSQQLRYSRVVGEGFTLGAIVDASLINFSDAAFGNAKTLTPQLFTTVSLAPRFTLSGGLGLAITRIELGGLEETNTALAGNLSLCREGERSNLCINGSRQVLPSAIGGARVQTTGSLSYAFRLSERDSLSINGSYSTASEPLAVAGGAGALESINGSVRFERQLDERFRLFVSGGYLNVSGNVQARASNYQALVGIVFNLGNSR